MRCFCWYSCFPCALIIIILYCIDQCVALPLRKDIPPPSPSIHIIDITRNSWHTQSEYCNSPSCTFTELLRQLVTLTNQVHLVKWWAVKIFQCDSPSTQCIFLMTKPTSSIGVNGIILPWRPPRQTISGPINRDALIQLLSAIARYQYYTSIT